MSDTTDPLFDEAFLRRLEVLAIVARKVQAGRARGERRAKRTGAGLEFADHRDYAPGDDLRYLDWGVYGRLGRLLVRVFEEEEDLPIYVLIDASASMATPASLGRPRKIDHARRIAAALAYVGLASLDRVSIVPFSSEIGPPTPPARGRGRIFAMLDRLAAITSDGTTDLRRAVEGFVHRVHHAGRRGLVVVISDFFDPAGAEGALSLLAYHRLEPFVIQVVDEDDARPRLLGDVNLIDIETGEARELTVTPALLAEVARAHAALVAGLARYCATHAISCVQADTRVAFDELLLQVLRTGGLFA